ncbi:rRNA-processing protein UTP23 homolog [Saccoglossus kowalevskii]|uniref:rRNA-processing protein UTP23 homolog n=1 Tax=Saccoglossus kowalevskii TaxID=10224 RepID=A0ABM0GUE9_SACKO|nr:PREDICTED: rRNA-processing protein UTP23 homolog [Saccoglossus kowalevskii]
MKIKRYKLARKYLSFYRHNYGFRQPHQILIDGTFCKAALHFKINIKDQMSKYLGGEIQLLTTQCCILEAESLGASTYGAMLVLKRFQLRICGHRNNPVPAAECIQSMIGADNSHHYFVATQDPGLSRQMQKVAGIPLLYINNAINFAKPSIITTKTAERSIQKKIRPSQQEHETIKKLKSFVGTDKIETKIQRRRKIAKGPNPLSCKKKKIKRLDENKEGQRKRKRRKRTRTSSHTTV